MTKHVPFHADFEFIKKLNSLANYILILSAVIALLIVFTEKTIMPASEKFKCILNSSLTFTAIIYFLLDIIQSYLFHSTENYRKNDFIDNSLNSKLSEKNSKGYYTNDELSFGINKLGVNCFENTLFTKEITRKMLSNEIIKAMFVFILILVAVLFLENKFFVSILQLSLPFVLFQQTFKLFSLHKNTKKCFINFKKIYSSTDLEQKNSLIIETVLNYEKNLSWACVTLDSKIFEELNPVLSAEWIQIKNELGIKE